MSSILLTFKNGKFVLFNEEVNSLDRAQWERIGTGIYQTSSFKAARAFRSYASENVKKVFNRAFAKHYNLPSLPSLSFLDPHQLEGVKWILSRSRAYLAHAPGAGKTAQAIVAASLAEGPGQNVFIVPPSLTLNWQREVWEFTKPLGIFPTIGLVTNSSQQERVAWRADYLIIPDSMISKPWVIERLEKMRIKLLAVDEASRFKESDSERGRVFYGGTVKDRRYFGIYQEARHVVFLDGSPMPNRPMELWAPTYALHPESIDCMEQRDFGFRYCGAKLNARGNWEFNHSSNEDELRARLQKDFMHVVTESQLSHPERRRSLLYMNQDVRSAEHKTWERRHLQALSFDDLDEDMSRGEIAHYRAELGMRKVPWIASYLTERLKGKDESILLFAWHRDVVLGLAEKLKAFDPMVVMGGTRNETREAAFMDFQSGRKKLIIGNIGAMGRGHNLQKADRVVFGEYSWTDELNKQCEKRASRRGRDAAAFVRCEYVVAPDSMDEPILNSVFTKERRTKRIIG